jgi:threonine/homoserine/homoserine lactone efflux protein
VISGGQLLGFMAASLVMIIIPGPGVLFVIGRALAHGRRTALATAVGHAAGNFVVAAFVAVGLGAILQRSATAFVVVKVIGAAYLVWLGIQAIRHRKSLADAFAAVAEPGRCCCWPWSPCCSAGSRTAATVTRLARCGAGSRARRGGSSWSAGRAGWP